MWYQAIITVISILFSIVLYRDASMELAHGLRRQTARIYTQFPVFQNNAMLHSNTDIRSGDHRLLFELILFNIIVVVGAGFASYWLARRTLSPIEAAHQQQKRFTADVSHELRTPLTAIKMESEVALLGDVSSTELKQTIHSNLEEVAKLEDLINNLLRLSSLEASELQQQFNQLRIADVCATAVARVAPIAKRHNITITSQITDAKVVGDADSLTQLCVILLDNAIKYSPDGSTVELQSSIVGGNLQLNIIDHGSGIERTALDHVFDRFYRADNSRNKTTTKGYGLGLSIAKMIADVHNATITLASRLEHGTTATLIIAGSAVALDQPVAKTEQHADAGQNDQRI